MSKVLYNVSVWAVSIITLAILVIPYLVVMNVKLVLHIMTKTVWRNPLDLIRVMKNSL